MFYLYSSRQRDSFGFCSVNGWSKSRVLLRLLLQCCVGVLLSCSGPTGVFKKGTVSFLNVSTTGFRWQRYDSLSGILPHVLLFVFVQGSLRNKQTIGETSSHGYRQANVWKINSVQTRGIAKTSGFTRGVCKIGDLLNLKVLLWNS